MHQKHGWPALCFWWTGIQNCIISPSLFLIRIWAFAQGFVCLFVFWLMTGYCHCSTNYIYPRENTSFSLNQKTLLLIALMCMQKIPTMPLTLFWNRLDHRVGVYQTSSPLASIVLSIQQARSVFQSSLQCATNGRARLQLLSGSQFAPGYSQYSLRFSGPVQTCTDVNCVHPGATPIPPGAFDT